MRYIKDLRDLLIVILVLIIVVYQLRSCNTEPPKPKVETKIEYRDVKVKVPVYVPKWKEKIKEVYVEKKIDTAAVIADYYAKYKVIDTVYLQSPDSSKKYFGYGIITDVLNKNKIMERSLIWNYKIPHTFTTITIKETPRNQLYLGVSSGLNKSTFIDNISSGVILKNKRDNLYQLSLGLGNRGGTIGPFIQGGMYWKIRLKKPKADDYFELSKSND